MYKRQVLDALQKAVAHGIFGYSEVKTPYYQAVAGWFERHFGWRPEESWLIKTPGVVCAPVSYTHLSSATRLASW